MTSTTRIAQLADGRWASYRTNSKGDEYAAGIFDTEDEAKADARADRLQEEHNALWTPILAAHRVAAALRTIADATPALSVDALEAYVPGLSNLPVDQWQKHLRRQAEAIEKAAPLPLTPSEEDLQALFGMYLDCQDGVTAKDHAREQMYQMTEADKAEAVAQMGLDTLLDGGV